MRSFLLSVMVTVDLSSSIILLITISFVSECVSCCVKDSLFSNDTKIVSDLFCGSFCDPIKRLSTGDDTFESFDGFSKVSECVRVRLVMSSRTGYTVCVRCDN